jgi:hypothetical protein
MVRVLVLIGFATILGQLEAAPVPKGGPKQPWKFPTQVGTKWVYTESGDRDASVTEEITKVAEGSGVRIITIRSESEWVKDGTTWGVIDFPKLWLEDESLFETSRDPPLQQTCCLLKFRCAVGDTWEWKVPNAAINRTESRVAAEEKVKVPAGTFECVRVETKSYRGEELAEARTDWYAAGVGRVKSTGHPNEKRVRVLKAFTPGKD